MKLSELCKRARIYCPREKEELEITAITCDSRKVEKGSVFVCLPSASVNGKGGLEYCEEARQRGCAAIICQENKVGDFIYSDDTLLSMSKLCRAFYGDGIEKLKLVGVTGTNGKSTCVSLLKHIFEADSKKCASVGTLGCNSGDTEIDRKYSDLMGKMTTPDPEILYPMLSCLAKNGYEYVFLEASSHALARKKLSSLDFEAGIFTNLTRDHLDFHLTKENYIAAKASLAPLSKRFIVNADDPASRLMCENAIRCSVNGKGDVNARNVDFTRGGGFKGEFDMYGESVYVESKLVGDYHVMNALECFACAKLLGVQRERAVKGIKDFCGVPGRSERVLYDEKSNISVYVDYAHTPDSLEKLLLSMRRMHPGNRLTLLFGCGGDRDRGKRKIMGIIASSLADFTVVTSDNPRSEKRELIINDILKGIDKEKPYTVIESRSEAIKYVIENVRKNETVVLAGKGHEKYEIDGEGIHPFDEKAIVLREWRKR